MKVTVIYSPEYLMHDTGKHPESPLRVKRAIEAIKKSEVYLKGLVRVKSPRRAEEDEIEEIHSRGLLEKVKNLSLKGGGVIAPETIVSKETYNVALLAAGGAIRGVEGSINGEDKRAFALIRPPGHHAERKRSKGFCIFNNVAIAAAKALKMGIRRILIMDWDAHHGDGTQKLFYSNPSVLYISIHQDGRTLYPGTGDIYDIGEYEGEGYTINIPLPPLSTGKIALRAMEEIAIPIIEQFKPHIILVSAGYDGHYLDDISDLMYTSNTYSRMMERIVKMANKYSYGRVVAVLEGGYHLKATPKSIVKTIEALAEKPVKYERNRTVTSKSLERKAELLIKKIKNVLSDYWSF
ncbi:MAG: histone deacetylase [Candidatus Verstraetearchaeota archaeon]|nr:histone deacetylase [Candidatus Verstraetearchaeota archaeon]